MADRLRAAKQGIDTEALSPRDANAQLPHRVDAAKVKAALATKVAHKEKEHPPPPPSKVYEPPSSDRKDGATYQIGKMLGKGGFAVCYEGQMPGSRKKYALKVVKSKMPTKMEQKFQTELQIHSKMRQQNIVQFFRAFSYDKSTYLVLELCPNGSLMDMVKRRKGLTMPEVRFYTVQIAGAIKYMHAKGIIHRDLKMGNIFLDKHMNAKIGDFGLAALLVTGKDMQTIRRTTLCGTPNYIAPEILEKGKKGHDHMVDIWSLGIIMYAMLTSKPPFQSSTTDEIYRRARNRDYEWPVNVPNKPDISPEAKDLVAIMLEEADQRPEPDTIVQHPFFATGYVPVPGEITPMMRDTAPEEDLVYMMSLTPNTTEKGARNLKALCRACEVGPWNHTQKVYTSTWKEVAAEEKAGLTPIIPLAENIVYRPFDEVSREQRLAKGSLDLSASQSTSRTEDTALESWAQTAAVAALVPVPMTGLLRVPPQSFAAQQRAQSRPSKPTMPRSKTVAEMTAAPTGSGTMRQNARRELPRSNTDDNILSHAFMAGAPVRLSTRTRAPASDLQPVEARRQITEKVESKREVPIQKEAPSRFDTIFSPSERQLAVPVPQTKPDVVLDRLRQLQAGLQRALDSKSMAAVSSKTPEPILPRVVKWVDYSNKFGLGYILDNGAVGCVLRSISGSSEVRKDSETVWLPPTCILVRDAESHHQRREDPTYPDLHEVVPMKKGPIHFYENNGEAGLSSVSLKPTQFRVQRHADGVPGKIPVKTIYDCRKRERLSMWKRFAHYMIKNGRDQENASDDSGDVQVPSWSDSNQPPNDLVTFYQRIGDVGCWVFADGHLQFNFPDHTKILLDATGTWCNFFHLSQEAAETLASTGELIETALDERSHLSYPLETLLNFDSKPRPIRPTRSTSSRNLRRPEIDPMLQGIPAANNLRGKVEFIKSVVREWVTNGGIGNSDMSLERRLRWTGARQLVQSGPSKQIWGTVGARWGDDYFTALVDPKKPNELVEDVRKKPKAPASAASA